MALSREFARSSQFSWVKLWLVMLGIFVVPEPPAAMCFPQGDREIHAVKVASLVDEISENLKQADEAKLKWRKAGKRSGTELGVAADQKSMLVVIRSEFGIDAATVARPAQGWPAQVVVRMHLKGLEFFEIKAEQTSLVWSVESTGTQQQRETVLRGGERKMVAEKDPLHAVVQVKSRDGRIPLRDGYFELRVPQKLLKKNLDSIHLRWIDFYRN